MGNFSLTKHELINKKLKAPYRLPKEKFMDEDRLKKFSPKPIATFLKNYGKPIIPRKSLDEKWDQ